MTNKNEDLHGNAPDQFPVALLIIDMINDLGFPGGQRFLKPAVKAGKQIATLKQQAKEQNISIIYVNDNFGR